MTGLGMAMRRDSGRAWRLLLGACSLALIASPALAQRAGENAVRSAEDAFGSSIGNESIGLYSPSSVRGFSPLAAGNVRLEGLYYDAAVGFNGRLIRGSTVRVGISAQGYPFPAPTGIADNSLRLPGSEAALSIVGSVNSWGGVNTEIDGQTPILGDALAVSGGVHLSSDKYAFYGGGVHSSAALIFRIRPTAELEILPFWSGFRHHGMDVAPTIAPSGAFLPAEIERGRFLTQSWAEYKGVDQNFGALGRWRAGDTEVAAGVFRSVAVNEGTFSDLFTDVSASGVAGRHLLTASPGQKFTSTSGELRVSHSLAEGPRLHTFIVAARARDRKRRYGGGSQVDLGRVAIDEATTVAKPLFAFGPSTRDHVRQQSLAIGYQGRWKDLGELTLGLQRVDYRKDILRPDRADPPTEASPWLFNAGAAVTLSPRLAFYGSYTRGLEESPAAPNFASNRDEAPPAIMTRQYDGGVRWTVTPQMKLVAGLFNVEKPYFSVDEARRYRQLGEVRHRGVEISLVGQFGPQLRVVGGAVLLDATVSGEDVDRGAIGKRPVGAPPTNLLLSADFKLPWVAGLSADVTLTRLGELPANSANTLRVPASQIVGAGLRYSTAAMGRPVTLRLQASNLFNDYSWNVLGGGVYFYTAQRQVSLRITTDL